jgi:hypothetical protein
MGNVCVAGRVGPLGGHGRPDEGKIYEVKQAGATFPLSFLTETEMLNAMPAKTFGV